MPQTYRLAGAAMVAAGSFNALFAAYVVLTLGVVCIGLAWVVPLAVALGEVLVGALVLSGLPLRFARPAAAVGIVNASLLFDPAGIALEAAALVLLSLDECRDWVALPPPPADRPAE